MQHEVGQPHRRRRPAVVGTALLLLIGVAIVLTACGGTDHAGAGTLVSPQRPSSAPTTATTAPPTTLPNQVATLPPPTAPPTVAPTSPPPRKPAAPPVTAEPVLGNPNWAPYSMGFGTVRPDGLSSGGDPLGIINDVTWDNWGGPRATGHGTAADVRGTETVAAAGSYNAEIVAFDLGDCEGRPGYRKVTWYFPQFGDRFDPTAAWDVCTPA